MVKRGMETIGRANAVRFVEEPLRPLSRGERERERSPAERSFREKEDRVTV
jgi:hypothetical protein